MNLSAEPFAQAVFEVSHMRILSEWSDNARLHGSGATGLQPGHQTFRLPDIQTFLDHALGRKLLLLFCNQAENYFCMTNGNSPFAKVTLQNARKLEQT